MNLQAACPDSGCTTTFSANHIPTAVAILNACRERLLAGRTQTPAGITSGLGKTSPSLLVGLQLPCFSVSGVCRRCGGSSRAGEAETAGTVPWAGARTDNSCDTRGCERGRGGVWSWSWAMSGWMKITARSYLYPRWYLPSTEITTVMGLMIDLIVGLPVENLFRCACPKFLYETWWSAETKCFSLIKYFIF